MEANREREEFSHRLRQTLRRAGEPDASPAALARGFNRRYPGKPVTVYAARKWLNAEALPSQDKLRALSDWLGVSSEWLRFGEGTAPSRYVVKEPAAGVDYELMRAYEGLSEPHQSVVWDVIRALQRIERDS
ncbi:MAG: hypothetical protein M0P39_08400 [Rhodocyclaceae bacterium]|jgi:transcriptional regulator with XRE-family HTH domain|nr:hypothetical protein [Rhodocyclaceae bacterium]